ncbi:MAG: signal peptide peptidase SppA [Cyclobacteriaceae bacterium]
MSFFKNLLSSCLGTILALVVTAILGIFILISISSASEETAIDENSVLHLRLNVPVAEQEVEDPIAGLLPDGPELTVGLLQLKEAISRAKSDPKIKGILLQTEMIGAGPATIEELRNSLKDFRKSGKWVVSWAGAYTESSYFLSSAADRVYLNPNGMIEFNGLSAEVMFFKKMFDKLEIKPEVFRVGEFKSAVEPFLRENLSEENKLQLNAMLSSVLNEMMHGIAEDRKIPIEKLREISNKMLVRNSDLAVTYGLVDSLLYEDGLHQEIRKRLGLKKDERISFVRYTEYTKSEETQKDRKDGEISVIVADGTIMPGKADNGVVGSKTIVEALRRARKSDRVKAVVLRINSPGGSYTASDDMWREIILTSTEKPVIASMSDYAASGGYYLAMACDTIVARPTTITGSIGIFSVLFDLSGFMGNKIGLTTEEVKTGETGNLFTFFRPLNETEKSIWQTQTDEIYEIFTRKAAEGRGMTHDDLKKIASGRVWTGTQAKENGLVDVLGGLDDAIQIAAKAGGIKDYQIRYYPRPKTLLEKIVETGEKEIFTPKDPMLDLVGPSEKVLIHQWNKLKEYGGPQARMPFEFRIN